MQPHPPNSPIKSKSIASSHNPHNSHNSHNYSHKPSSAKRALVSNPSNASFNPFSSSISSNNDRESSHNLNVFQNRSLRTPQQVESLAQWMNSQLQDVVAHDHTASTSPARQAQSKLKIINNTMQEMVKILAFNCKKSAAFVAELWSLHESQVSVITEELSVNLKRSQLLIREKSDQCQKLIAEKNLMLKRQVTNASLNVIDKAKNLLSELQATASASDETSNDCMKIRSDVLDISKLQAVTHLEHLQVRQRLEAEINAKNVEISQLAAKISRISVWFPHFDYYGTTILGRLLPPIETSSSESTPSWEQENGHLTSYLCQQAFVFDSSQRTLQRSLVQGQTRLFFQKKPQTSRIHGHDSDHESDLEEEEEDAEFDGSNRTMKDNHLAQWYLLQDVLRLEQLGIGFQIKVTLPSVLEAVRELEVKDAQVKREHILLSLLEHRDRYDLQTIVPPAGQEIVPCCNEDCVQNRTQLEEITSLLQTRTEELRTVEIDLRAAERKIKHVKERYHLVALQAEMCEKEKESIEDEARVAQANATKKYNELHRKHDELNGKYLALLKFSEEIQRLTMLSTQILPLNKVCWERFVPMPSWAKERIRLTLRQKLAARYALPNIDDDDDIGPRSLPCIRIFTPIEMYNTLLRCLREVVEGNTSFRCFREAWDDQVSGDTGHASCIVRVKLGLTELIRNKNFYIADCDTRISRGIPAFSSTNPPTTEANVDRVNLGSDESDDSLMSLLFCQQEGIFARLLFEYFCSISNDPMLAKIRVNSMLQNVVTQVYKTGIQLLPPLPSLTSLTAPFWPPPEFSLYRSKSHTSSLADIAVTKGAVLPPDHEGEDEFGSQQDSVALSIQSGLARLLTIDFAKPTATSESKEKVTTIATATYVDSKLPKSSTNMLLPENEMINNLFLRLLAELCGQSDNVNRSLSYSANSSHLSLEFRCLPGQLINRWQGTLRREAFTNLFLKYYSRTKRYFLESNNLDGYLDDSLMRIPLPKALKVLSTLFHIVDLQQPTVESPGASSSRSHCGRAILANSDCLITHSTPWWCILPASLYDTLKVDTAFATSLSGTRQVTATKISSLSIVEAVMLTWNTVLRLQDRVRSALEQLFDSICIVIGSFDCSNKWFLHILWDILESGANSFEALALESHTSIHYQIVKELQDVRTNIRLQQYARHNPSNGQSLYDESETSTGMSNVKLDENTGLDYDNTRNAFVAILLSTRSPLLVLSMIDLIRLGDDEADSTIDDSTEECLSVWKQYWLLGHQLYLRLNAFVRGDIGFKDGIGVPRHEGSYFSRDILIQQLLGDVSAQNANQENYSKEGVDKLLYSFSNQRIECDTSQTSSNKASLVPNDIMNCVGIRLLVWSEALVGRTIDTLSGTKRSQLLMCVKLLNVVVHRPEWKELTLEESVTEVDDYVRNESIGLMESRMNVARNQANSYRAKEHYQRGCKRRFFAAWVDWAEKQIGASL